MIDKNHIVAVDLGSNSFRVVVYDYLQNIIIDEFQAIVGFASAIPRTGKISIESQEKAINAIKLSSKQLNYNPKDAIAVTTAAMRYASNSQEVIKNIQENTGMNFKIIDANEEARLTLLAIKYALKRESISKENFIVLDIGGGSTELIINSKNKTVAKSFSYGIVTISQKYEDISSLDENTQELQILKEQILIFLNSIDFSLEEFQFIATAGTPTILAATKIGLNADNYDRKKINGTVVTKEDVKQIYSDFSTKDEKELYVFLGDVKLEYIKVGTLIYKLVFELLNKSNSIVFDDGLREGVAIDHFLTNLEKGLSL